MRILTRYIVLLVCALSTSVWAHDLPPLYETTWTGQRAAFPPIEGIKARATQHTDHPTLYYVIVKALKWNPGESLMVCFYGGSPVLRMQIASVAGQWMQYGNIKLDFGGSVGRDCAPSDPSQIRIGFGEAGYWSYIGRESLDHRLKGIPTMNFEAFDTNPPPDPDFSGIVLHEFGHALGLHHEHQNPTAGCDTEINWPIVYQMFARQGWDQAQVDQNMRSLMTDSSAYEWSNVDRLSIMHYSLDKRIFIKGDQSPCYVVTNRMISELDRQGINLAYPTDAAKARDQMADDHALLTRAAKLKSLPPRDATLLTEKVRSLGTQVH